MKQVELLTVIEQSSKDESSELNLYNRGKGADLEHYRLAFRFLDAGRASSLAQGSPRPYLSPNQTLPPKTVIRAGQAAMCQPAVHQRPLLRRIKDLIRLPISKISSISFPFRTSGDSSGTEPCSIDRIEIN